MADVAGTKVGTGYVAVDADFGPFHKRLEVFRQAFTRETRGLGADMGKQLAPALDGVSQRLRSTGAEADRLGTRFRGLDNATAAVRRSVDGVGASLTRNQTAARGFGDELGRVRGAANDAGAGVRAFTDRAPATRAAVAAARTSLGAFSDDLRGVRTAAQDASQGGLTPFGNELDRARAKVREVGEQVKTTTTDTSTGFRRWTRDSDMLGRSFTGLTGRTSIVNQRFQLLRNMIGLLKWPAIITGAGLAAQALSALGAAAVAVTAAVGPAVGVLGALPGALAAAAQGFGVFRLATMGVADALREQLRTQVAVDTGATKGADTQRAAARAIASAQEGVRSARLGVADAVRRVQDAERSYADSLAGLVTAERAVAQALAGTRAAQLALSDARRAARQQIVDTRAALTDALLTEERATFALRDARAALAALEAGPSARALADAHERITDAVRAERTALFALQDAHRAVDDAMRGEERAVLNLADAHDRLNALLAGPDAADVADAEDSIADAMRNEERAALDLLDAQRALAELMADPRASAEDIARARLELADAENAVGDAARATARARERLAELQAPPDERELAKARLDVAEAEDAVRRASDATAKARHGVEDAEDGVTDAQRASADAREALAELEKPASAHELAKARLAVREAEDGLTDAIRNHRRAAAELLDVEARAVEGSQLVIDARQGIADANEQVLASQQGVNDAMRTAQDAARGVTDAERDLVEAKRQVRLALQGVRDAQIDAAEGMDTAAASAASLNEEFDRLPPAAQAFVRTLLQLKPRFDELRNVAAEGFFPGARAGLLAAARNFEPVRRVVGATARALGWLAETAGRLIGSAGFGRDLERIGLRNADVIRRVGRAAILVGDALRHVMVAAGPLLTWLARTAERWGEYLRASAEAGRESGRLARFFEQTRAVLERLGSITSNVARAFWNIGRAAAPLGREILAALDRASDGWARWTGSVEGQRSLARYFNDARPAIFEMGRLLRDIVASFFRLGAQLGVARLLRQVRTELLPALERTLGVLTQTFGPAIVNAITQVVRLFSQLAGAGGALSQIVRLLGSVAKGFGWILANVPGAKELTFALIGMAGALKAIKVVSAISGITLLGRAALATAGAHRALAAGTAAVEVATKRGVAATLAARTAMLASAAASKVLAAASIALGVAMRAIPIVAVVSGLVAIGIGFKAAYDKVEWFRNAVDAVVDFVKTNWPFLIGALTGPLGVAIGLMVRDFDGFVEFVKGIPGRIVDALKSAPGALVDAGGWVIGRIVEGAMASGKFVLDAAKWYLDTLVKGIQAYANAWLDVGKWVLGKIKDGFVALAGVVVDAARWYFDRLISGIRAYVSGWGELGRWVLARIVNGFTTVIDVLSSAGEWFKNRIVTFVHDAIDGFKSLGTWVLARVMEGFRTVVDGGLLSTVGDWLRARIGEFVSGAVEGFKTIGLRALNFVVDGFTTLVRDGPLSTVGNWLKNRIEDFVKAAADGFKSIGRSVIGWIVDGLHWGLRQIGRFINAIIGAINLIPGVDIKKIDVDKIGDGLARGGSFSSKGVEHYATGGQVRRGTVVDKPMIMMGEEAPRHPEFVIPTNPAYRDRARMLLGEAAQAIGFFRGGWFESTAYGPPWDGPNGMQGSGVTSTGIDLPDGVTNQIIPIVAVDPAVIPYHTSLVIQPNPFNWIGPFAAEDTGGAIRGNKVDFLDMFGRAHQNAWGRRTVRVDPGGQGLDDLGSGGGSFTGDIAELLSKGWRWITGKFPNPADMLPSWLVGTGEWVIDQATGWVKDQVGDVFGGIGGAGGMVTAPPVKRLVAMIGFANRLESMGIPYGGGGHAGLSIQAEEDCSSTVSKVLNAGGYLNGAVLDTTRMASGAGLKPGPGRWITVHNRPLPGDQGHVILEFPNDRWFGTSGSNPGGGPGWFPNPGASYVATMAQKLHPNGLARGGVFGGDGASIAPFVGSYLRGGMVPQDGMAYLHGGEEVIPPGQVGESVADAVADALEGLELYIGDEKIDEKIEVRMRKHERISGMGYRAGAPA